MFQIVLFFLIVLLISFALYLNAHENLIYKNKFFNYCHRGLVQFPRDMYYIGRLDQMEYYKEAQEAKSGMAEGLGAFAELFIAFKKLQMKIFGYKTKIMAKFVMAMFDAAQM